MLQHRPVLFLENVCTYFDDRVWPNSDEVAVEGGVMDLAQSQAVPNLRHAAWVTIGDDVARIEQLAVAQPTESALVSVGCQHTFAKRLLVKAGLDGSRDISASCFRLLLGDRLRCTSRKRIRDRVLGVRHDRETQSDRIVADDEDGPDWQIATFHQAEEVNERRA